MTLFSLQNQWLPAVNIKNNKTEFDIEVAAPGLTKSDFKVTVDNGILHIAVEKEFNKKESDNNFTRREFSYNSFNRSFTLPDYVDDKNINAEYTDGILRLHLRKTRVENQATRKIAIR